MIAPAITSLSVHDSHVPCVHLVHHHIVHVIQLHTSRAGHIRRPQRGSTSFCENRRSFACTLGVFRFSPEHQPESFALKGYRTICIPQSNSLHDGLLPADDDYSINAHLRQNETHTPRAATSCPGAGKSVPESTQTTSRPDGITFHTISSISAVDIVS